MWATDRNHTLCTEFYFLQQNAFRFWPSWLSTVRISVKSHGSPPTLRRIWQKLWNSAPAQPGLQRVHPNTITVLASAIPAAQASLLSTSNPTSMGTVWCTHVGGGGGEGREVNFWPRCCTPHGKNTCYVEWCSHHSSNFYHPLLRRTNRTACCCQTDSTSLPTFPSHRIRTLNFMCGKNQCNKERPNNMFVFLSTYLSRALSLLRCWKKEGSQMSWLSWQTCLQDFPGSAIFTWRALNGGHITCPWQKSCSDRSYFIIMHPVPC